MLTFAFLLLFLCTPFNHPSHAGVDGFSMNWQFALDLPGPGISGLLKGHITHIQNTEFRFDGEYLNRQGSIESGPISVNTVFKLGNGKIEIKKLLIQISKLGINNANLKIDNPDIKIKGQGIIRLDSNSAKFDELIIEAAGFHQINASLDYSPVNAGSGSLIINNPLPLLEKLAESFLQGFNAWDKEGEFTLKLSLQGINSAPKTSIGLSFKNLAAASPDGAVLLDSISGALNATAPIDLTQIRGGLSIEKGETLYDTFYMDFAKHPLDVHIDSISPLTSKQISGSLKVDWNKIGKFHTYGTIKNTFTKPEFSLEADLQVDELEAPFRLFASDPLSLDDVFAGGEMELNCKIQSSINGTLLTGTTVLKKTNFDSDLLKVSGVESTLPFSISLNENFIPQIDENIPAPKQGHIRMKTLESGPVKINDFAFPITISSNDIGFGNIPAIMIEGGKIKLDDLSVQNPFSDNFVFHGRLNAQNINLLPISPASLPVNGELEGNLEFWLLMEHLSTSGSLSGDIYGGEMVISEIFAENIFEDSRQFGADFKLRNLDLAPLSKALDIGRITGRMDLDLNNLVIAYDQPAGFKLRAVTTPGSDSDRDISLKAVNTLSVIGTGSGLTGAGVGIFSQFFKEFGYAGLGLECTLDNDIFKIRGLIREDGIEYIIKRPPLFGINVVNSNPENLISFSDMLKRINRVIGN